MTFATNQTGKQIGVLQLVDTLSIGGTERMAVSLANALSERGYRSFLCATREDGPLLSNLSNAVGRICLNRKRIVQWRAIRKLVAFIRENNIDLIHAHSSSIVTANLVSRFSPYPKVVWHDHFGPNAGQERPVWIYRNLLRRASEIICVSEPLRLWSRDRIRFAKHKIHVLPNFFDMKSNSALRLELPGKKENRIVLTANLRPVKDHIGLIEAMGQVHSVCPEAQLLFIGGLSDQGYVNQVKANIEAIGLSEVVTLLGPREDVPAILSECSIGVNFSKFEGLPVSILEYGAAGLATIVTDVGQCAEVVDHGSAGVVVSKENPQQMASAIIGLLQDRQRKEQLGDTFKRRVRENYSADACIAKLSTIYARTFESTP